MRILDEELEIIETTDDRVLFIADADIDCDGSGGNPDNDPYFQPDTSLHFAGKALNAYKERFIVVPPVVVKRTVGIVLGCQAYATNLKTGRVVSAVVGDLGPTRKTGEVSVALAIALGLDGNPNHGGTDDPIIGYEILPGVGASVEDKLYDLQAWHGE